MKNQFSQPNRAKRKAQAILLQGSDKTDGAFRQKKLFV